MRFTETRIAGAWLLELEPQVDSRGFFARTFCARQFAAHGLEPEFQQGNISFNHQRGTLRGLHFQYPPHAETKLWRPTRGRCFAVIVDLRPESSTWLMHQGFELAVEDYRQLYVPARCAFGYQTLEDATEVSYFVGASYAPEAEGGLSAFDQRLGISWPLPVSQISERDTRWPPLEKVGEELRRRMAV